MHRPRFTGLLLVIAVSASASAGWLRPAAAQLPGAPVLQNAFANPGITLAANAAAGSGARAYAAAVAWAPGSARFVLSAGAGTVTPDGGEARPSYGGRIAMPVVSLLDGESVGVGIFAGVGGAARSGYTTTYVPVGGSVSYRRALGATRGLSVYAAPFYLYARGRAAGMAATTSGLARASAGIDVAVTPALGITLGAEGGATAKTGEPGPTGAVIGAAVSYALGR